MNKQFVMSFTPYTIRIATTDDLPHVLEVMRHNFHFEETIFHSLYSHTEITKEERKIIEETLDDSVKIAFDSSPCLVAIHNESNKIVGVNVTTLNNNPKYNVTSDKLSNLFLSNGKKPMLIANYFHYLNDFNKKADLFGKYPDKKTLLEFYAIAIDKNHRRKGLSGKLIEAGILFAQGMENISLVFGTFTSPYSMKSAEKNGMHTLLKINLLDYKNNDGELIFANTKPNNIIYFMILEV